MEYLAPDPLPLILPRNSLNLLAAASGVGKTAFIASFLATLRRGEPVFGYTPNAIAGFGYLSADRPWLRSSRLWFEAAGFGDIPHYSMVDDDAFALAHLDNARKRPELLAVLLKHLKLPPGSLLVVDPIAMFLGGNLNNYDACARSCIGLQRVLRKHDLTMIGLTHASKQKTDAGERYLRPQDRILGSMALNGYSSTQMYLLTPEEAETPGFYQFGWSPHHAPSAVFPLRRLENGLFEPVGAIPSASKHRPLSACSALAQTLYAQLPAVPADIPIMALLSLVQDLGSRTTIFRYLKELEDAGHVAQPKRGRWQGLPEPTTDAPPSS